MAVSLSALVANAQAPFGETSLAATLSAAVPSGSLLILTAQTSDTSGAMSASDSKGHTWNSVQAQSGGGPRAAIFWTVTTVAMTTSDTVTVAGGGASFWKLQARYATGFDPASPVPTTGSGADDTAGTTIAWSPDIDTAAAGDLLLFNVAVSASGRSWSAIPSGFTSENIATGTSSGTGLTGYRAMASALTDQPGSGTIDLATGRAQVAIRIKVTPGVPATGTVTAAPALTATRVVTFARTATVTAAAVATATAFPALVRSGDIAAAPVLTAVAMIDDGSRTGTITAAPALSATQVARLTRTGSLAPAPALTATQVTSISPQRAGTIEAAPVASAVGLISKQTRTGTITAAPALSGPGIPDISIPAGPPVVGNVDMRLRAYAPNGASLGLLPAPSAFRCALPLNDIPALTLTYGINVPRAELLGQPLELAVEVTEDGGFSWWEPFDGRFLYLTDGRDPAKPADEWAAEAKGYVWRLTKARVLAEGALNGEGRREFSGLTAGQILATLWAEADNRGALEGMNLVGGGTTDADGASWILPLNRTYDVGQDYLSVLMDLEAIGYLDFRMSGRNLLLYRKDAGMAYDRTVTPAQVTLTPLQVTEAPYRRTWEGLADQITVLGDNGASVSIVNAGALKPWGRWEDLLTAGGVEDTATLTAAGQRYQAITEDARTEYTHGVALGVGQTPLLDFQVGDYIWSQPTTGGKARYRVRQITLEKDGKTVQGNVVLNDRFLEQDIRQRRIVDAIISGASSASTGPLPTPPGPDILQPAAVTSLTGSSSVYVDAGGSTWGLVSLDWPDVTTNLDGTPLTDLDHYEVQAKTGDSSSTAQWQRLADSMESRASLSPYVPGDLWTFRVRAVDSSDNRGPWSPLFTATISADTTGPVKPSTPTATSRLGNGAITWNGLAVSGLPMDADFAYAAVHLSTVNGFTWGAANRFTTMLKADTVQVGPLTLGATYYGRLVPYDTTGNPGTPSDQFSFTVAQLYDTSNFPADAAPYFASYVGEFMQLNADQVTANAAAIGFLESGTVVGGIFQTTSGGEFRTSADPASTGGIRVRGTDGFRAFGNKGGGPVVPTASIDPVTGLLTATGGNFTDGTVTGGTVQTGTSGVRAVMETSGGVGGFNVYDSGGLVGWLRAASGAAAVAAASGGSVVLGSNQVAITGSAGVTITGGLTVPMPTISTAPNVRLGDDNQLYKNADISFGAANSAGTGFKVVRAPN